MNRTGFWFLAGLALGLLAALPAWAGDCPKAEELLRASLQEAQAGRKEALLREAVRLCPGSAQAWNNLGLVLEKKGRLVEAEAAYRRALTADPDLAAAWAGLGDAAAALGKFQAAADCYSRFLAGLEKEKARGDPDGLAGHEDLYRTRRDLAAEKWRIHQTSLTQVVASASLEQMLNQERAAVLMVLPGPERLTLAVNFGFDSAELTAPGRDQLVEVARFMASPAAAGSRFVIQGHTDTFGSAEYNLKLSLRRAGAARQFLLGQGLGSTRLEIQGLGKERPIRPFGGREEQAVNRRVEFVGGR